MGRFPIEIQEYIIIFIMFLLFITPILKISIEQDKPTAEDWNRHGKWILEYASGDFSNITKYLPFYHIIMIPFVLFLGVNVKYMQLLFGTLAFFSIILFAKKFHGINASMLSALILGSSVIFTQYAPALMPQTLDFILMPLAVIFMLEKRYLKSAFLIFLLSGMHLFGIFVLITMFIYSFLVDKRFLKYLVLVFILILPFYYLISSYSIFSLNNPVVQIGGEYWKPFQYQFQVWSNDWDRYYTYPLTNFLIFTSPVLWLLTPIAIYSMYKVRKYDRIQLLYVIWFIVLLPLIIFNLWRWFSYAIIPTS